MAADEYFNSGMFQSKFIHCCTTFICMRTLNSCHLDDFFVDMEVQDELLNVPDRCTSYFTLCVTEIDFPTCIYITKRFLRLQTYW